MFKTLISNQFHCMKVLFVTDNYCLEEVEGIYYHRYIDEHINAYKQLGSITLAVPVYHTVSYNRVVDLTGVEVRPIDKENTVKTRFFARGNNKRIIEEEVRKTDIVIGFVPSPVCEHALRYARKHKKTFISVVIASAWDIQWNHSLKGKLMAPISHFTTAAIIRDSDYVIYVTDKYLQGKYPTKGKGIGISDVVIPAADESVLVQKIERIKSRADLKKFSMVTLGAINVKYKAQDDVIRAIALLQNEGYEIDYTLVGGGSEERIRKAMAECGVDQSRIHFYGSVPHEKVCELLDDYDIYIQPSRTEGLPRSVVEAMSRGMVAICSDAGGMFELVGKESIYKAGDVDDLAALIRRLTSDVDALVRISAENFNKAKEFRGGVLSERRRTFLDSILNDISK